MGIDDVKVNFLAERITVRYDPEQIAPHDIQQLIEAMGYKVSLRSDPGALESGDAEAAQQAAERRDLTRRIVIGAVLTFPVMFAMMAHEFFHPSWLPQSLLNPYFQLALISPVMFYVGWPIHRTGWLTLRTAPRHVSQSIGTRRLSYSL
jgi:Cu+-exporting ATPase